MSAVQKLFKVTTLKNFTRPMDKKHRTKWIVGQWMYARRSRSRQLCTDTVLHAFASIADARAFFFSRDGARRYESVFPGAIYLWEAEGRVAVAEIERRGLRKVGCTSLRILKRIPHEKWQPQ